MKVGTDGTLLGAWVEPPCGCSYSEPLRILDVGTGTGLIALMLAQRFPESAVVGIDIDGAAVSQARENVADSPFADRVSVVCGDVNTTPLDGHFDMIVSNPPYFEHALQAPDERRTLDRHTASLSYGQLIGKARQLLAADGQLSVIIPFDCLSHFKSAAALAGFFLTRECAVKTTPRKSARRYLLTFALHPSDLRCEEGVIEDSPSRRSAWYESLTRDFYL